MILYDDKHNFLGMSSHTLGFLGYEDIGDFLSLQKDFAELFVNKEGFIYNFENFNWIDFVLYSGSANKSAIITLKNGQETKVDISIKEVHLAEEIGGIKKLYSVKLISNNFREISGIPKSNEGSNGFSLSGLVAKESKEDVQNKEQELKIENEKDDFQDLINDTKEREAKEQKSDSFILNIGEEELISKDEPLLIDNNDENQEDGSTEVNNDFKIEVENTSLIKDPEATSNFILDDTAVDIKQEPAIEIKAETKSESGFFLKSEKTDEDVVEFETPTIEQNQQESEEIYEFNLLKTEENMINKEQIVSESSEEVLTITEPEVNFLKTEEFKIKSDETDTEEQVSTQEDSGFKLDFLTNSSDKESTEVVKNEKSIDLTLDNPDKKQIIEQIKDDIKEIDTVVETKEEAKDTFSLDIPLTPQVEQPLNLEQSLDKTSKEDEIIKNDFQIKESQTDDMNNSFTSTLKGLFGGSINQNSSEESQQQPENEAFAFTLKSDLEKEQEISEDKDIDLQESHVSVDNNIQENIQEQNIEKKDLFSSMSSLGLNPDDEFDLLNDFISDAKESIETIEEFIKTKDFDKINYALVKIKSSAEILNLNDIIENSNSIRKHCITENSEQVTIDINKLKENISLLEKHLETAAV